MSKRRAIYIRVSSDRQAEDGLGLDVQEQALRARAPHARKYVDVISGANEERPALERLEHDVAAAEFDEVWVYRLDRLARKLWLQEWLIAKFKAAGCSVRALEGVDGYSDDDDLDTTMLRQIVGAIAERERRLIGRRLSAGLKLKRERGGYGGGVPAYGWRVEYHYDDTGRRTSTLERVDIEQKAIGRARFLRSLGWSLRTIGATLTQEGYPPRGTAWHVSAVEAVLRAGVAQARAHKGGTGEIVTRTNMNGTPTGTPRPKEWATPGPKPRYPGESRQERRRRRARERALAVGGAPEVDAPAEAVEVPLQSNDDVADPLLVLSQGVDLSAEPGDVV